MARCGCASSSSCSCVVTGGSGINVSGSGTSADPYTIDSTATSITGTVIVSDTPTVDMTLAGSGSVTDPYDISAQATVSVGDLEDVAPATPATGDTLLWDGEQWTYGPPSSGGGGTVIVTGPGITGDGSTAMPVSLATSGAWGSAPLNVYGSNTLLGAPIYIDANGRARSQPRGADVLSSGASRPNHYPGRMIVQDGVLWVSNGTTWMPMTPTVEGPLRVAAGRWSAAGIVLQSGVSASTTTSYAEFHRYGPIITMYLNRVSWTPRNGATHSDITNHNLFEVPASMAGIFALSGTGVGTSGRLTNLALAGVNKRMIVATAISPNVTNTSTSQTWPQVATSMALSWQLAPGLDPEEAFASIRANVVSAEQAAELDRVNLLEGI